MLLTGCATTRKDFVFCPKCHKALIKKDSVCPKDGAPLNGYKYWFWSRERKSPVMAFKAETYLVKDMNGEFHWYPEEVDLKD
jgi:hypothetical protein